MITQAPFIPTSADIRPFYAELFLIGGIAANLLLPFGTRRPNLFCATAAVAAMLLGVASLCGTIVPGQHLHGMLIFDSVARIWKITLLLFVCGVVLLWLGHGGRSLRQGDAPEFFVLLLGATLGMCLMASTTHLLLIFMAIAIASLSSYLLAGFTKRNRRAGEASLKYVLFGAISTAIMIYGISFLYGLTGTLQLSEMTRSMPPGASAALAVVMIGLLIGIGFKISAVPLHFWCPDVFEGASIEVTAFLSVASKGAALLLLLRIVLALNLPHFAGIVGLMGALTATVGNTAAFSQKNIKRLLAYSSIAQAGYMMCLISAADPLGELTTQALLLYLIIYAVMNLGAFAVAAVIIGQSGEELDDFAGLGRSSPLVAGSFFCCLISLIGLPPVAGFGAKVNVLWVLAQGGGFGIFLVVVVVLNTVLSAFYYFRIVRAMYFEPANERSRVRRLFARDPLGVSLGWICAGTLVLMFFGFGPLYFLTSRPAVTAVPALASHPAPVSPANS